MSTRNSASVVETTPVKKGEYRAILGIAGAGFIGSTSVMFSVKAKGLPIVAHIKSSHVPPMTLISNGEPISSFRIYANEESRLLFVVTENLIPAEGCWPITEGLLKWLREKNTTEIYAIDGLPFSAISTEIKALAYSSKIDVSKLGYPILREGAISGINSCILDDCVEKGSPYACLFIPTTKLTTIDYMGSAEGVEVMNRLFKLGVDPTPLREMGEPRKTTQKQTGFASVFKRD